MTLPPRQPLSPEERALQAQLPRLHGRCEPDAGLDARILAAAQAAVQAPTQAPALRQPRRWATPLALAASLCLAVGVAWQVQQTPRNTSPAAAAPASDQINRATAAPQTAQTAPSTEDARAAAMPSQPGTVATEAEMDKPSSQPRLLPPSPSIAPSIAPPIRTLAPPPPDEPPVVLQSPRAFSESTAAAPAPAPALPAPPAPPPPAADTAPAAQTMQRSAAAASDALAAPAQAKPAPPMSKALHESPKPTPAAEDAPLDDVPPATMASPAARDAWLHRIQALQAEGKLDEARASLEEFRRRYPDVKLPANLRALEPAPAASDRRR